MTSHIQDDTLDISIFETHIILDEEDNDDHSFQEQQDQREPQLVEQDQNKHHHSVRRKHTLGSKTKCHNSQ